MLQMLRDLSQNIKLVSRINYDFIAISVKHTIYWMSFKYQQLTRKKYTYGTHINTWVENGKSCSNVAGCSTF